jgi:hypothetical protein
MPRKNKTAPVSELDLSLGNVGFGLSVDLDISDVTTGGYDPLADVPNTGSMEADSLAEMEAIRAAFAGTDTARQFRAQREQYDARTDSEYWFCAVFQSRAQKDEFLRLTGLEASGDKYLDGREVAAKCGVQLTPYTHTHKQGKIDPVWAAMVRKETKK